MGVYHGIPAKWHCSREAASRQTHVFNCTNYFVQVGYRWGWLNFFTYPLVIKRGMLENTSFVDLVRWFSHHWQPGRHWTPDWTWLFGSSFQYQTCQTIDVLGVHEKLIVPSFNLFLGHFRWRNKIQQTWPSHGPFDIFWRTVWEHQTIRLFCSTNHIPWYVPLSMAITSWKSPWMIRFPTHYSIFLSTPLLLGIIIQY